MGWRGFLRAVEASNRRANRQHQRVVRANQRHAQAQYREAKQAMASMAKAEAAYRAAAEAHEFATTVEVLRSVHHEASQPIDWNALWHAPAPTAPQPSNEFEGYAQATLAAYRPSWLERLFGSTKRIAAMEKDVLTARDSDALRFQQWQREYAAAYAKWEMDHRLARAILSHDPNAYRHVLEQHDVFDELEELGSSVNVEHVEYDLVEIDLYVNSEQVIPSEVKALTAAGKLSTKKMPISQFNEMYQDYVCGSALRVAREVFAVLPVSTVHVHAIGELLNSATGHLEHCAILSASMPRQTVSRLRFETLDASDSMRNFVHRMAFKKASGFSAVEPIPLSNGAATMQTSA